MKKIKTGKLEKPETLEKAEEKPTSTPDVKEVQKVILPPPSKLTTYQVKCCSEKSEKWGTTIQVTKWINETGYEIIVCNSNGAFQHLSITQEEMDLINKMIFSLR